MRFVFFHRNSPFTEYSTLEQAHCNGCRKLTIIQDIPQEVDIGHSYSIKLCHQCLLKLAEEIKPLPQETKPC